MLLPWSTTNNKNTVIALPLGESFGFIGVGGCRYYTYGGHLEVGVPHGECILALALNYNPKSCAPLAV